MMLDLQSAQHAATATLNAAAALVAGASTGSIWLARGSSPWALRQRPRAQVAALVGLLLALLANAVLLWLEAAAIAEVPVAAASGAAWSMLTATHYGIAWGIGTAALLVAACVAVATRKRKVLPATLTLAALAVFFYTRSMVSHAASEGDFGWAMLADWLHLGLISLWVGEVIFAGLIVLAWQGQMEAADRRDRADYVQALSTSATFALAGIFITGLFSAWHNVGSLANAAGNPYADTLLVKLALVAFAAALGGINRFLVMPPLLARERDDALSTQASTGRFALILRIETAVLLAVLLLAAVLSSTSPPTAA